MPEGGTRPEWATAWSQAGVSLRELMTASGPSPPSEGRLVMSVLKADRKFCTRALDRSF